MHVTDRHNFHDFRLLAKKQLPGPIFDYIDGAAEDEATHRRNTAAFEALDLVPNILRGVSIGLDLEPVAPPLQDIGALLLQCMADLFEHPAPSAKPGAQGDMTDDDRPLARQARHHLVQRDVSALLNQLHDEGFMCIQARGSPPGSNPRRRLAQPRPCDPPDRRRNADPEPGRRCRAADPKHLLGLLDPLLQPYRAALPESWLDACETRLQTRSAISDNDAAARRMRTASAISHRGKSPV